VEPDVRSCFSRPIANNRAETPAIESGSGQQLPKMSAQTPKEVGQAPEDVVGSAFNFNETELNLLGTLVGERMTKKGGYILKFVSKGATEGSCIW